MNKEEHELNLLKAGNHPTRRFCNWCRGLGFNYKRDRPYMCLYCEGKGSYRLLIPFLGENTLGKIF